MWRWCLNSKQAVLQLRVEDSRRDERGQKKLPTPDSHVDGEKCTRTAVYNTKRNWRKKGRKKRKKRKRAKGWRKITVKRRSSILLIILLGHIRGYFLYPRIFRLALSPTLYKFIVRAFWAWAHSCFGFESKLVLTKTIEWKHFKSNLKIYFKKYLTHIIIFPKKKFF